MAVFIKRNGDAMYLYHYYEKSNGPFRSLSDISKDEADEILARLHDQGGTFASYRKQDYMKTRKQLELHVRKLFIEKGGKPLRISPHYMVLEECPYLMTWYRETCFLRIPIESFKRVTLSFTYGDMFPTFNPENDDGKEYRKKVYTYGEILRLIEKYGLPQSWNADGHYGPERYIEVQVWSDEVIGEYIHFPEY